MSRETFNIPTAKARLLHELGTVRNRGAILLLCGLLAATLGCSAKVEVQSENWDTTPQTSSGEKNRTTVEVDVLQAHPTPNPPSLKTTTSGSTTIINLGDGDVHVHQAPARAESDDKPTRPTKSTFNTKIGWPGTYWEHGPSAFLGSVAVWVLVGTAVVLMVATVGRTEGGPLLSTIGLLTLVAILLQALPASESGIQFIPLSPWAYSGLVPICLSILSWIGLLLAAFIAILSSGLIGAPSGFSAAVLFSLGCNLLLSLGGVSAPSEVASASNGGPVSSKSQVATGEEGRAAVLVDLPEARSSEPVSAPKSPELPPPPKPVPSEAKPLNICGNTVVFNFRGGDVTYHSDIDIHVHEPPRRQAEEQITVRREVENPPRRPVDERCQRMAREHEERVRAWRGFPGGY